MTTKDNLTNPNELLKIAIKNKLDKLLLRMKIFLTLWN